MNKIIEIFERIDDGEMEIADIPILAAFIIAAIFVIGGLIGCGIWLVCIPIVALFTLNATKLLMLIPCAAIFSVLLAIAIFVWSQDNW